MHEGPDVYMREGKKKDDFESGLADSLLKSLQTPSSASSHQSSSSAYARISSSPGMCIYFASPGISIKDHFNGNFKKTSFFRYVF